MALSININVNNSDISIKNSKTGAKKNIKSISAGNLNDMTDREFNISQKRKIARKQAMKLISDAWDKDNKAAQGIKDMESEKAVRKICRNYMAYIQSHRSRRILNY